MNLAWYPFPASLGYPLQQPCATRFGATGDAVAVAGLKAAGVDAEELEASSWSSFMPDLNVYALGAGCSSMGGQLFVVGGLDASGQAQQSTHASAGSGTPWTAGPPLITARAGAVVLADAAQTVYAIGGYQPMGATPSVLASAETLVNASAWSPLPSLVTARVFAGGAVLPNGDILVAGGNTMLNLSASGALLSTERFVQAMQSWQSLPPLATARFGHAGIAGPDGRIYMVGGTASDGTLLMSTEIYDPAKNAWIAGAPLTQPRTYLGGVAASSGRLLALGGTLVGGGTASVEAYGPTVTATAQPGVITLTGAHFAPNAALTLTIQGVTVAVSGMTAADGTLTGATFSPQGYVPGTTIICVLEDNLSRFPISFAVTVM
jgi:hypothetical protein